MISLYIIRKRGTIQIFFICTGTGGRMKKYEVVANRIIEHIGNGEYRCGSRLPAIRNLAEEYQVNKSTIITALAHLQDQHYVYAVPRGGYYVMDQIQDDNKLLDFDTVKPDDRLIPYQAYRKCIDKAIDHYKYQMFGYTETEGLESLRKVLVQDLLRNQVHTNIYELFVTSGAQQGLYILLMLLKKSGKTLLMEEPGYQTVFQLVEELDIPIYTIKRDVKGYDMKQFRELVSKNNIGMFYCNPRFQNPTGTTLSEKQKKIIVELADRYDFEIIEDDSLVDIEYRSNVLPMHYYDTSHRENYIKSYSKTFMPGIRLGVVVVNKHHHDTFYKLKRCMDINTSVLHQGALSLFIESKMIEKHLNKITKIYKDKMILLKHNFEGELDIEIPDSGLFLWVKLPENVPMDRVIKQLEEGHIKVTDGRQFYLNNSEKAIRLCVYNLSDKDILEGLHNISSIIKKALSA
jgi:DNA-binding transcriptional MocR family regulator